MRITVVIPNRAWANTAGVRIRYDRIAPAMKTDQHEFTMIAIDELRGDKLPRTDAWIISKCHDARSLVLAHMLKSQGRLVGVDFFDDYYSQSANSRFVHLRGWFRDILPALDFGLCSTPNMHAMLNRLAPDLPCHIMNDPFASFDIKTIAKRLRANADRARATRHIDIGWFGIGDNPHFNLGLDDLSAMADVLGRIQAAGYTAHLSILTNRRALTVERLARLARLPVPFTLDEWSEEAEVALVANSLLCFLPVNAQPFSMVKSLNRAVTTLSNGAQILSAGFPLYEPLGDYIYRDPLELLGDLETDRLKLRPDTLPALEKLFSSNADPLQETRGMVRFLKAQRSAGQTPTQEPWPAKGVAGVVHGVRTSGDVHKGVQRLGHLSIASPMSQSKLNYDVEALFDTEDTIEVFLSDRARRALPDALAKRCVSVPGINPKAPSRHRLVLNPEAVSDLPPTPARDPLIGQLDRITRYKQEMGRVMAVLRHLFGAATVFRSEMESPYWADMSPLSAARKSQEPNETAA